MAEKKPHVLIVEDDFALSDAFGMILTASGYEVHRAHDGKEALEYLEGHMPDAVLLDILMPVMDGREFLKNFKNDTHVPIVALSNLDAKDDIEEVLTLGASRYILKSSVTPETLTKIIKEII
jgi:CheY-like chemotaxis protein